MSQPNGKRFAAKVVTLETESLLAVALETVMEVLEKAKRVGGGTGLRKEEGKV